MAKEQGTKELTVDELMSSDSPEKVTKNLAFERGLGLLEELVEKVEAGSLPLEKAIQAYERGVGLIEQLRGQLSGAEEKLKVLQRK